MRKILLFLSVLAISCASKQTRNSLLSGDYDEAVETATESLKRDRDKKSKQDLVYMLEEAFAKAKERDLRNIDLWKKEKNPANYQKIYNTYVQLESRQEKIRPLLPLKLLDRNRNAHFPFDDYSKEIVKSKANLVEYLYANSQGLLNSSNKADVRKAYDDLDYVNRLSPGYKDATRLMDDAKFKGTDFVHVYTRNDSGIIIPARLESDLLDFSTAKLNDKWTVYHSNRNKDIRYDYAIVLNFREILISPEHVKEREFKVEREIKDGKKKLKDRNGNVVRDENGKVVMVDNLINVRGTVREFRQTKSVAVTAKVDYIDLNNNQLLQSFPLASEFVFDHMYATIKGDRRAVEDSYRPMLDKRALPFPSNEQMVYDTGEDLKAKLKSIITSNRIKRR